MRFRISKNELAENVLTSVIASIVMTLYLEVTASVLLHFDDFLDDKEAQNEDPDDLYDEEQQADSSGIGVQVERPHHVGDTECPGELVLHQVLHHREHIHIGVVEDDVDDDSYGHQIKPGCCENE